MRNFIILLTLCFSSLAMQSQDEKFEFDQIEYPYEVKKIDIGNEIEIAYIDEGSGSKTLVFIHGLGSYLPAWKKNIESLKSEYRCIALDLPGYGKSSKGNYDITLEFYADKVVAFLDSLNLKNVTIAGHSMGGQISIITALKYSNRIDQLVLIAPAGFEKFNKGEKKWFRQNITAKGIKYTPIRTVHANIFDNFYNLPDDAKFMITDRLAITTASDFDAYCYAVAKSVDAMINQPVLDYLKDLQQKTLIIFGENDNLIPNKFMHGGKTKKIAEAGHELIPNSELIMIPKCGHFAQFEKFEAVNAAIKEFLK